MIVLKYNNTKVKKGMGTFFFFKFVMVCVLVPWVSEVILRTSSKQFFSNASNYTGTSPIPNSISPVKFPLAY